MTHEPLCSWYGRYKPRAYPCDCQLIAKVRRDERRLMRARVEALPRWVSRGAVGYQAPVLAVGLEQVLTALHALEEKP